MRFSCLTVVIPLLVMGGWFPRLETLLTGEPAFVASYQGTPHGTPTAIPGLDLDLVRGGGEPCNP